jgi:hypothetical protein
VHDSGVSYRTKPYHASERDAFDPTTYISQYGVSPGRRRIQ